MYPNLAVWTWVFFTKFRTVSKGHTQQAPHSACSAVHGNHFERLGQPFIIRSVAVRFTVQTDIHSVRERSQ